MTSTDGGNRFAGRQQHAASWSLRSCVASKRGRSLALLLAVASAVNCAVNCAPRVQAEEPFRMAPALAGQLGRIDCRLVGGRIRLTSQHIGGQMSSTFSGNGKAKESFELDLTTAWPRLEYRAVASTFEIRVSVSAGEQVAINAIFPHGIAASEVNFKQLPEGGVEFNVRQGGQSSTLEGRTLWHIWLADPELCAKELLPLLQLLRPTWEFDKQGAAIEHALLVAAEQDWTERWPRWTRFVEQLNDDQFARRRAADQALRSAGLAVVPFLQSLDESRLDPEPRSRVRRIIARLKRFNEEDTPDRAALWLAGDPSVWLTLMARDDASLRRLAAGELAEILGRSIEFEPDGDAALRAGQLARLRVEVLQPVSTTPASDDKN